MQSYSGQTMHYNAINKRSDKDRILNFIPDMQYRPYYQHRGITFHLIGFESSKFSERTGAEWYIALGHHKDGEVLNSFIELSGNKLIGWNEHKMILHESWYELPDMNNIPFKCYRTISSEEPYPGNKPVKTCQFKATIIRHEAWEQGNIIGNQCARFKAWFVGETAKTIKNLPAITLPDLINYEYDLPEGFTIEGRLGERRHRILEWPTSDLYEILNKIKAWQAKGATELRLSKGELSVDIKDTDFTALKKVVWLYNRYGPEFSLFDIERVKIKA